MIDLKDTETAVQSEYGWLLDNGLLCIGLGSCSMVDWVTYTDENAIRFARAQDAVNMRSALRGVNMGISMMMDRCKPVEHAWG